jgi:hypothetical protein
MTDATSLDETMIVLLLRSAGNDQPFAGGRTVSADEMLRELPAVCPRPGVVGVALGIAEDLAATGEVPWDGYDPDRAVMVLRGIHERLRVLDE